MTMHSAFLWYTMATGRQGNHHLEAQLMLVSLLAHASPRSRVAVFTDQPQSYQWLKPAGLLVVELSQSQIDAWINAKPAGSKSYFFRAKLALAQHTAEQMAQNKFDLGVGAALWIDCDVLVRGPLASWEDRLDAGACLMQKQEAPFSLGTTKTERAYWSALKQRPYGGIRATHHSRQWNSGVLAVPADKVHTLSTALGVLDDLMRAGVPGRTREQVAAGLALETTGKLEETGFLLWHYWANKPGWEPFLRRLVAAWLDQGADPQAAISQLRALIARDSQAEPIAGDNSGYEAGADHGSSSLSFPPITVPRPPRAERWKRKIRKHLGLAGPLER